MGLLLSVVISYAGIHEAIECVKHILSGIIPNTQPDFQDLMEYYTRQLQKSANSSSRHWTDFGEGYLSLTEDKNGKLKSAAIKFYNGQPNSTAILFSTKISSFGQDSIEEPQTNGDCRTERYTPTKTKTILTNTSDSLTARGRSNSPASYDNTLDQKRSSTNSLRNETDDGNVIKEKLNWQYQPLNPTPLPEIHFQSYDEDKRGVYSEEFLRSLDGIKFQPLQRSDPSGRRRSFKKRHSSSSTSSKDSRASREEELKLFTSLEEAEFERMSREENVGGFGSTPNLSTRSYSRSRSRERRSVDGSFSKSVDSVADENTLKPRLKDVPKLDSFEEETKETNEVTEDDEDIDFWANSGD